MQRHDSHYTEAIKRVLSLVLLILAGSSAGFGLGVHATDWKGSLKDALEKSYPLSRRAGFSPDRITREGVVLVIQKPGIAADPSLDLRYSVTYVRKVQVGEQGGAVAALFNKVNTRVFEPGERVYVTGTKIGNDYVMLELLSCDMFPVIVKGSTRQGRYKAALSFKFESDYLPTADPAKIESLISQVIATQAQAAAQNTKTISLGQTIEQVQAILGQPDRVVDLGPKKIFIYKDMKVIFTDGKVSDVQ
ncbi:MAG TPA: hypothetical protein VMX16_17265 [Terriglobia bacterium]|nr:hypothetical protein [Terriglobia bacterium]